MYLVGPAETQSLREPARLLLRAHCSRLGSSLDQPDQVQSWTPAFLIASRTQVCSDAVQMPPAWLSVKAKLLAAIPYIRRRHRIPDMCMHRPRQQSLLHTGGSAGFVRLTPPPSSCLPGLALDLCLCQSFGDRSQRVQVSG